MSTQVTRPNHEGEAGPSALRLPATLPTYHLFGLENTLTYSHPPENIGQCLTVETRAKNTPDRARHLGGGTHQCSHTSPDDDARMDGEDLCMGNSVLLDYK